MSAPVIDITAHRQEFDKRTLYTLIDRSAEPPLYGCFYLADGLDMPIAAFGVEVQAVIHTITRRREGNPTIGASITHGNDPRKRKVIGIRRRSVDSVVVTLASEGEGEGGLETVPWSECKWWDGDVDPKKADT